MFLTFVACVGRKARFRQSTSGQIVDELLFLLIVHSRAACLDVPARCVQLSHLCSMFPHRTLPAKLLNPRAAVASCYLRLHAVWHSSANFMDHGATAAIASAAIAERRSPSLSPQAFDSWRIFCSSRMKQYLHLGIWQRKKGGKRQKRGKERRRRDREGGVEKGKEVENEG